MDKEQEIEKIKEIIHSVRPEIGKDIRCWKDRVAEKLKERLGKYEDIKC